MWINRVWVNAENRIILVNCSFNRKCQAILVVFNDRVWQMFAQCLKQRHMNLIIWDLTSVLSPLSPPSIFIFIQMLLSESIAKGNLQAQIRHKSFPAFCHACMLSWDLVKRAGCFACCMRVSCWLPVTGRKVYRHSIFTESQFLLACCNDKRQQKRCYRRKFYSKALLTMILMLQAKMVLLWHSAPVIYC